MVSWVSESQVNSSGDGCRLTQMRRVLDYFVALGVAHIKTDEPSVLAGNMQQIECCHFSFESR